MDDANSSKVICPEAWSNLFISGTPYAGCTDSLETALTVIGQYEIESTSSFVHTITKKNNFALAGKFSLLLYFTTLELTCFLFLHNLQHIVTSKKFYCNKCPINRK